MHNLIMVTEVYGNAGSSKARDYIVINQSIMVRAMNDKLNGVNMLDGYPARGIIKLSVPIVLGSFLQQIYSVVDAFVVSKFISTDALGSVGATSSIQFLVLGFCIGCCAGFAIPVAQSFGAGEKHLVSSYIANGFRVTIILSIIMTTICIASTEPIMRMLKTPYELYDNAKRYLITLFCGIPCTFAYNLGANILRACGNSKLPFRYLAYSSGLNIILDILFVSGFHFGVQGTAVATILSQAVSAILCFGSIASCGFLHLERKQNKFDKSICGRLLSTGIPTGLQYSVTAVGTIIVQSANNALGSVYTTAFFAGSRIRQLFMCPFDGIATGASVFAAQNYGANQIKRVRQGVKQGVLLGVLYGFFAGTILTVFAHSLAGLFLSDKDLPILSAATSYLRVIGAFLWLLGILNVLRMCIQGLGHTKLALGSGVVELFSRFVLCTFWVPIYGFNAICMNEPIAWIFAATYVGLAYLCLYKRLKVATYESV